MIGAVNRDMPDNCGLGHDVERTSCEAAARAIIANRGDPYRLREAAEYVLAELDEARQVVAAALAVDASTTFAETEGAVDRLCDVLSALGLGTAPNRALSAVSAPAEAGSGNGAGGARSAVSGRPGASQGPSEGEGSER